MEHTLEQRENQVTSSSSRETATPQTCQGECTCGKCGSRSGAVAPAATPPSYVYAVGKVIPRIPKISVEKEIAQATGRAETVGLTDPAAMHHVLSAPQNRYLARQLCWVFAVEGLETYILYPRDPADLSLLIESLRPNPRPGDVDVVIGMRGPIAQPDLCNGLMVPVVAFDQLYSFDMNSLIKSIPRPDKYGEKDFTATAEEVFMRIMQLADNAGATDEHRALNYLAVRCKELYANVAAAHSRNESLTSVNIKPSTLSGTRKIVDVVLSYTNRTTDVIEKFAVGVDVTEEFPFLVRKLSPYYDH